MRHNTTTTAWASIIAVITALSICAPISAQVVETGRLNLPDSRYQIHVIGPGGEVYVALDTVCIAYDTTFAEIWRTQIPNTSTIYPWVDGFTKDINGDVLILKETYYHTPGVSDAHIVVTKLGNDGALHWSQELTAAPGFPDYSSYSRGPYNFWEDPQGNIYVHDMISVNISGNCWSELSWVGNPNRSWLFSLAPSGSDRWSIVKSIPDDVNFNAQPLGAASDGSCYMWNNVVGSDCWGSNADGDCLWIDLCTPTLTYTMAHYNSAGTEEWEIPIDGSLLASIAPSGNQYRYNYNDNTVSKYTSDRTQVWSFTAIEERIGNVFVSDNEEHVLLRSLTYISTGSDQGYYRTADQCLNSDGSERWRGNNILPSYLSIGINNYVFADNDSLLYAIPSSDSLTCIDLLAGRRNWTQYIERGVCCSQIQAADFMS